MGAESIDKNMMGHSMYNKHHLTRKVRSSTKAHINQVKKKRVKKSKTQNRSFRKFVYY